MAETEQNKDSNEAISGEVVDTPVKPQNPPETNEPAANENLEGNEQPLLEEKEGFGAQLAEFLEDLHITPRHIGYGAGCLVLIAVAIYGGIKGYNYWKDRGAEETKPPLEVTAEGTGIPQAAEVGEVPKITAQTPFELGIGAAIGIGRETTPGGSIALYVFTFRRLQNAYATDVTEMLNQTTDRRGRLKAHLALLRSLHEEGTRAVETITAITSSLAAEFEKQKEAEKAADERFFNDVTAFEGQAAEDALTDFVRASTQAVTLRARYKALQKVRSFYVQGLPRLANRIKDIELNEEALVSGLTVYDVTGSDLSLIVPVQGESVGEGDRLRSPAFPLIPINPTDVKTERDFITQPGGGF